MQRALWCHRELRRLWLSEAVSVFGSWFTSVAVMASVYAQFRSASMVAMVGVFSTLPSLLLNAWLGRRIRLANAKHVMVASHLARAALAIGLAFCGGHAALYIAGACLIASFNLAFRVARAVYLPSVVSADELAPANSGFGVAWGLNSAFGAVAGGALVAALGDRAAFLVDAATFVASALLLRGLAEPPQVPAAQAQDAASGDAKSLAQTVRFVWSRPPIRLVVLAGISWGIVGGGFAVLMPVYGSEFAGGGAGIGLFYGIQAAGFLFGSLRVGLGGARSTAQMQRSFCIAYLLQALGFCLFAGHWFAPLVLVGLFLTRFFGGVISPLDSSLLQAQTPQDMLARVSALHFAVFGTVMQLSMALTGVLADVYSAERVGLVVAMWGVASAVCVLLSLRSGRPALHPQRS